MRRPIRLFATLLALASVTASCAIREQAEPRDIPPVQADVFGASATGDAATGERSIYLLAPAGNDGIQQLRAVRRNTPSSANELLNSLVSGPNSEESAAGMSSAIPAELRLRRSPLTVGTRLTIDINSALDELSDLGLRQALAQIVATASEIEPVQQVRLRVNGELRSWPTGDGEVTDQPLSIYDFPGFLESSQPPFPALPST